MDKNGQLSPSQTTELLRELEHAPVKKLGQNFLVDSNIVRKSLELADVREGDNVVEVGPGLGTLTGALLGRGANVYAVELDRTLFAFLSKHFEGRERLNLINADAVDFPLAALPEEKAADFKIVANLPYAISTPWLDRVLSGPLPKAMSLMLQKEAALRFSARRDSGEYSPISICLGEAYDVLPPPDAFDTAERHGDPSFEHAATHRRAGAVDHIGESAALARSVRREELQIADRELVDPYIFLLIDPRDGGDVPDILVLRKLKIIEYGTSRSDACSEMVDAESLERLRAELLAELFTVQLLGKDPVVEPVGVISRPELLLEAVIITSLMDNLFRCKIRQ